MDAFNRIFALVILLKGFLFLSSCQQLNGDKLNEDQKEILSQYVSEHVLDEDQHLYFKSEESLDLLKLPLTPEDFKLPEIAMSHGAEIQPADTLFSKEELNDWGNKISNYKQFNWDKNYFREGVDFIKKEEIPDFLMSTDIPPPDQDPVFIHYISPPFIYQNKSALLYSRRWSSGANVKVRYHYYKKNDKGEWKLIQEGPLNVGY